MPKVWVYTLCYNEALIMPYFLRHYATFAERVIVYVDAETNDGTREIVASTPKCEARIYPYDSGINDIEFTRFAEATYKEARGAADWVIWVDADEFIYHPSILEQLAAYDAQGVTLH